MAGQPLCRAIVVVAAVTSFGVYVGMNPSLLQHRQDPAQSQPVGLAEYISGCGDVADEVECSASAGCRWLVSSQDSAHLRMHMLSSRR